MACGGSGSSGGGGSGSGGGSATAGLRQRIFPPCSACARAQQLAGPSASAAAAPAVAVVGPLGPRTVQPPPSRLISAAQEPLAALLCGTVPGWRQLPPLTPLLRRTAVANLLAIIKLGPEYCFTYHLLSLVEGRQGGCRQGSCVGRAWLGVHSAQSGRHSRWPLPAANW